MTPTLTRTVDSKARVALPKAYAGATVIVEEVSDTELRIRLAKVVPADDVKVWEETRQPLSDRDRDLFLALLDKPPRPRPALRRAAARDKRRHG